MIFSFSLLAIDFHLSSHMHSQTLSPSNVASHVCDLTCLVVLILSWDCYDCMKDRSINGMSLVHIYWI